jgi:hypothetical protein
MFFTKYIKQFNLQITEIPNLFKLCYTNENIQIGLVIYRDKHSESGNSNNSLTGNYLYVVVGETNRNKDGKRTFSIQVSYDFIFQLNKEMAISKIVCT